MNPMKNFFYLSGLISAFSFFFSINLPAQWTVVNTGLNDNLSSICMGNNNRLCCSGSYGNIFLSDDGGESWSPANINAGESVTHISMLGSTGYAITDNGGIFKSTDNGDNWISVFNTGCKLRCVYTLSPSYVYAGGRYELLWEFNHGNWGCVPYVTGPGYWLRDIHFPDARNGYVVGDGGRAYKTPNNGYGWFLMNTQTEQNITGVYFPSPDTGYCAGLGSTLLKTVDGGISWASVYSGNPMDFSHVYFLTNDHGYVSATGGSILKTTDSGQTWIPEETNTTVNLREFCYLPEMDRLLVCGFNGIILYKDLVTNLNEKVSGFPQNLKVKVYPNPFDQSFMLEISGLIGTENELMLFGNKQEKVMEIAGISNGNFEIDTKGMLPGAYFYRITSNGSTLATGKLIKN
jgi:photosystem II stability/assembly factor-like uncharacterized protein